MTKKVVFIASSVRSGSTMLDLILGAHPQLSGLGELYRVLSADTEQIKRLSEVPCSCGEMIKECLFWGPMQAGLLDLRNGSLREKYERLFFEFERFFGKECTLVDSSKNIRPLRILNRLPGVDLRVLHLIKDVRAWTTSMRDAVKRDDGVIRGGLLKRFGWKVGKQYIKRTRIMTIVRFLKWYRNTRAIQDFLARKQIPTMQLGYEELCLYQSAAVFDICKFLEIELVESMPSINKSSSHNVLGNRMRYQVEKQKGIFYDNRWFSRSDWILAAVLLPHIIKYNSREVYRNTYHGLWKK